MEEEIRTAPVPGNEEPDLSYLDSFLKDAIETDTTIEYTVPLNEEGSFVNGVFYENYIDEAHIKVTVLEHITVNDEILDNQICKNWEIKLTCTGEDEEVIYSQIELVETDEQAVFEFKQDDPVDHFPEHDEISCVGVGHFTLSITATDPDCEIHSQIKISVS